MILGQISVFCNLNCYKPIATDTNMCQLFRSVHPASTPNCAQANTSSTAKVLGAPVDRAELNSWTGRASPTSPPVPVGPVWSQWAVLAHGFHGTVKLLVHQQLAAGLGPKLFIAGQGTQPERCLTT